VINFTTIGSSLSSLPPTWSRLQQDLRVARAQKGSKYFTVARVYRLDPTDPFQEAKGKNILHEVDHPLLIGRLSSGAANSPYTSVCYRRSATTTTAATSVSVLCVHPVPVQLNRHAETDKHGEPLVPSGTRTTLHGGRVAEVSPSRRYVTAPALPQAMAIVQLSDGTIQVRALPIMLVTPASQLATWVAAALQSGGMPTSLTHQPKL
jgi:hypothetical protein